MSGEDLSKLKIDKSVKAFQPKRRARTIYLGIALLFLMVAAFLYLNGFIAPAIPVVVATVSQVYPSQTLS